MAAAEEQQQLFGNSNCSSIGRFAAVLRTFLSILLHSASDTNALKPKSPDDCPELLLG
jgi:hypothetical protein